MEGVFIREFNSVIAAANTMGKKNGSDISKVCQGKTNSAYKYINRNIVKNKK
jgi:hypothetical protein